jgi:uncharacterized peroxidase-related enzyme
MPFFKSLPENSGPPAVYTKYPDIYAAWSQMSEALMNGPSPLSKPERELLFAYAAGVAGCTFVYIGHSEVAYASGIERGTLEKLLEDPTSASAQENLRPLLALVRKLMVTPTEVSQADVDAALAVGWDEHAIHDAIAISARAAFMQRLVQGHGFIPMTREVAAERAKRRLELGYVNLYPAFQKQDVDNVPK